MARPLRRRTRSVSLAVVCFASLVLGAACSGAGESNDSEDSGRREPRPLPLNLTVDTPLRGNFNGGTWTPAAGAAWYVDQTGKKLTTRFEVGATLDKRVLVKLWETSFDDPCADAYGSLAHNRWLQFVVPAKVGVTEDPEQGYRVPGGLVRVAYVKNRAEHTQVAEAARVEVSAVEPATRGRLAARTLGQVDAIDLAGDFAVELCIDQPLVPANPGETL